jgi:hypothetical protein
MSNVESDRSQVSRLPGSESSVQLKALAGVPGLLNELRLRSGRGDLKTWSLADQPHDPVVDT